MNEKIIEEGIISNKNIREYGRKAHLYQQGNRWIIKIDANNKWGTADKRKKYKTEKWARRIFDEYTIK
jgi:hypothetical protein